ncbi:MAG: glycosyltransferase family 1 protein [Desulfobacterales bacterium]|nr:glycosyltransferase family 1 protein [Desulfobacterales bacterium]
MNVSWFVPVGRKWPWQSWYNFDKVSASVWIRCLQLIPYLKKNGIESKINSFDSRTDIAVFLRCWDERMISLARSLQNKGVKVVVDTPVNYFSSQNLKPFKGEAKKQFDEFVDFADAVFCPSPYIAEFGNKKGYRTYCLEDSIDFNHFKYKKKHISETEKPVLIWSGVQVKSSVLRFLTPVIKGNSWKIIIIAEKKPDFEFNFEFIKWSYNSFPKNLLKGDIGIFPRKIEDEYDNGHSFFKIGVFLAQNIPVLCSPVPSYKEIMNESNSSSLSSFEAEEWEDQIISLSAKCNKNIDTSSVEKYSTKILADRYLETFKRLL